MKKLLFLGLITVLITSCGGPRIYTDSAASNFTKNHRTLAILPPRVSIPAQRNIDAAAMREQQRTESVNFQNEMYSWLLKRRQQGRLTVEIQDVNETIAKLNRAGFYEERGASMTPAELAEALGVDAVLASNYSLSKPMSQGAAIAVGVLFGSFGATNKADINLTLHDGKTGKMLWSYDHKASGAFGSPSALVDALMKNASKKLPYNKN